MSIPSFSEWPDIPQRSAPEADFDAKMYALFQHFANTHRNEMLAFISFLENNSVVIDGALNETTIGLDTPAAGKFTTLVSDSFGGAAVQSAPNDAEEGKILKTKAFGHGLVASESPALTADMDDAAMPTGATIYAGATTLNRPEGRNGAGVAWRGWGGLGAAGELHQLFGARRTSGGHPDLYYRSLDVDGDWGSWAKMLHAGNAVGPVSQSSGTPTGAVIERGSNANGEYVRFADGTQICWALGPQQTSDQANGAIFRAASDHGFTFPAAFIAAPSVSPAGRYISGGASWTVVSNTGGTGGTAGRIYSSVSGAVGNPGIFAIGRWF